MTIYSRRPSKTIKRDDLLHPQISGNKWRKLCYNLSDAKQQGKKTLLTFGGAYSNHIYAVAAAGQLLGFKTIGLIRGEKPAEFGATLRFVKSAGMELHFLSRTAYRQKEIPKIINQEKCFLIPEGGTNGLAIPGCEEIVDEVLEQMDGKAPDYWCLSCGTAGTITGVISGLAGRSQVLGFPALKGDFLKDTIIRLQKEFNLAEQHNWQLITDYHFGGYARFQPELIEFMHSFYSETRILLDPVYTGKLFFGIFDLIEKNFFPKGANIVAIHTGGLQGIIGFNERYGTKLPDETDI